MLCYMNSKGSSDERAKKAVSIMGSSIIVGIVCTKFLGVFVLAFASSTLFRIYYFRMYLSIIILGTFHGLFFLPVILSMFGPRGSRTRASSHGSVVEGLLKKNSIF